MKTYKACENCSQSFAYTRSDARFCTPRCAAQWARDHGEFREDIHAARPNEKVENCHQCGTEFVFNIYADRAGKRQPLYCSNKCRQAAYRARKGHAAGFTGNWNDARNDKRSQSEKDKDRYERQYDYNDPRAKQRTEEPHKDTSREKVRKDTSHKSDRWSSKDPYIILGVTYLTPKSEMKKAYMKLMKMYHPDVSKEPDALRISKAVNAAWDKLK